MALSTHEYGSGSARLRRETDRSAVLLACRHLSLATTIVNHVLPIIPRARLKLGSLQPAVGITMDSFWCCARQGSGSGGVFRMRGPVRGYTVGKGMTCHVPQGGANEARWEIVPPDTDGGLLVNR